MRDISTNIKKPELVAKRRDQIMNAAMGLFLKNGYHGTTMRQICAVSGVNRASIYDYFASKEDILVYIYKEVAYFEGDFDKAFPKTNITEWKDVEPYIKSIVHTSWIRNKKSIQLLYRETIALDPVSLKQVLKIESDYIKWVAENLRKGLGLRTVTVELEIITNALVFIDAFLPLRGWNMAHLEKKKIFEIIVEMFMTKLESIKNKNSVKKG